MKSFVILATIGLSLSSFASVNYYSQVTLPATVTQATLVDAQYDLIPTKTAVRSIPGCNPGGEAGLVCEETVVLESEAVIRANISYVDSMFPSDSNQLNWTSVVFNLSSFSADQVAALKAVYPAWKNGFSNVGRNFAKNYMKLNLSKVKQRGSNLVDMKRSKLCPIVGETGEKVDPRCQDQIVYKDSWTTGVLLSVELK